MVVFSQFWHKLSIRVRWQKKIIFIHNGMRPSVNTVDIYNGYHDNMIHDTVF
jgi:hypothetical protein